MNGRALGTLLLSGILLAGCHRSMVAVQAEAPATPWTALPAHEAASGSVALTLYRDDWALVTDARPVALDRGEQVVRFGDVAAQTDGAGAYVQLPGSVTARRFRYDLLNRERLLARYHGMTVEIVPEGSGAPLEATLLITDSGPVYRIGDRLYTDPPGKVALPPLSGLATSPTFEWIVAMDAPWAGTATVSYVANQIGWQSEYTLITDRDQTRGDWKQWAALSNRSGADYRNARITLVSGDVRRDRPAVPLDMAYGGARAYSEVAAPEPFAARHLYRLNERVTLPRNADERIALRSAEGLAIERTYRVVSGVQLFRIPDPELPRKARLRLTIANTAPAGPGEPLPRGKVTVYTPTRQGELAIAGEPTIADTPVGQNVELDLGEAFDVTSERSQTAYRLTGEAQEVGYRILLRNQQDVPVAVWVTEQLSGDWAITSSSHPYDRLSATQIRFRVTVPAGGTTEVTYQATIQRERAGILPSPNG